MLWRSCRKHGSSFPQMDALFYSRARSQSQAVHMRTKIDLKRPPDNSWIEQSSLMSIRAVLLPNLEPAASSP
jgi:hypothetical protein